MNKKELIAVIAEEAALTKKDSEAFVNAFTAAVGAELKKGGKTKEDFLSQLDKMASDALESGSPQNTMRIPTKEQIIEIYKKLF